MLTKYALIAGLVACLGLGGAAWWFQASAARLGAENKVLSAKLLTCSARVRNILEDSESDAVIDNIPDSDLRNVPDGWLLPETGAPN